MGIPENWRMQPHRYQLKGYKREKQDGTIELSINGSAWVESKNGLHRHENPADGKVIYKAPRPQTENGRKPKQIQGTVEISASAGYST